MNDWTIMVYLAGENNLAEEMVFALKSMQLVGSNPPNPGSTPPHYEVFALFDAGVTPVTLRIDDRDAPPRGLPPAENLLETAETRRKEERRERVEKATERIDEADGAIKKLRKDRTTAQHKANDIVASLIAPPKSPVAQGSPKPRFSRIKFDEAFKEKIKERDRGEDLKTALAIRDELQQDLKEARAALSGHEPLNVNPVDEALRDFMIETIEKHPAHHYMLVLSGHGSGAVGDFLTGDTRLFGLSIPDLRGALAQVQQTLQAKTRKGGPKYLEHGKIDILGLDSCLMGMAEVAFEVRNYVDYLVGAEGFTPNTGWPYDQILNRLRSRPGRDARGFAEDIVREYIDYYSSDYTLADISTDLCALKLDGIRGVAEALGGKAGLSKLLQTALYDEKKNIPNPAKRKTRGAVVLAHWESQGYKNEQHVDLWDFCDRLKEYLGNDPQIRRACQDVKERVEDVVLISDYCGPAFQHSHGISVFFPWANLTDAVGVRELDHYEDSLEFAQKTHWDEFLTAYHECTQRDMRPGVDDPPHESGLNRHEGLFTGKPGKAGIAGSIKAGIAGSIKAGIAGSIKAGIAGSIKAGIAGSIKAGIAGSIKAGIAGSIKAGIAGSIKGDGLPKIASMKNPPIQWSSQKDE